MRLFLHIKITSNQYQFSTPPVQLKGDVKYFDIDNFSDSVTINTALKALDRTDKLFVFLEAVDNNAIGGITKVLNRLVKLDILNRMIYNGNHLALDKMISRFKNNLILDLDKVEVQKEVDQFFRD